MVGLTQSLELDSNSIDAVVSGLVLNFVPQPEAAISEMMRVTKPGGKSGFTFGTTLMAWKCYVLFGMRL